MKVHFIGIGGIGMSGLAKLLLMQNHQVSGSDLAKSDMLQKLEEMGALIHLGQKKENIPSDATVVVSTDIKEDNPELMKAKDLGLPILHRSDLLKLLSEQKFGLAVSGTHGKTTSSSLLVQVLDKANFFPSFSIGGIIKEKNAEHTASPYFVFEACESDGTLVKYWPEGAIITNIDNDHMDHYKNEENLNNTFAQFARQVKNKNILFVHESISIPHEGIRYGFSSTCDLCATNVRLIDRRYHFDIVYKEKTFIDVCFNSPLLHNVLNALAVFGLCLELQISEDVIKEAFSTFSSPKKRLEIKYQTQESLFIDDYGHHPTEIASTLKGVRKAWPHHRLIVLFQPHRYSRIKECMEQFKETFNEADLLYITEIYSAGEKPMEDVTSFHIIDLLDKEAIYAPRDRLAQELFPTLRPFDLVISFGAGNISKIHDEIHAMGPITPLKVALIYGGKSVEHAVSCKSSKHVFKGLDQETLFNPLSLYIDQEGNWHEQHNALTFGEAITHLKSCDVAFPVMHGKFGEDGPMQGMLEMLDMPYVGGPFSFNALSMDKAISKILVMHQGIKTSPFIIVKENDSLEHSLRFPLFVKPVHLGSSVGIKKVHTQQELVEAVIAAFQFDNKLIIEEQIVGRELEFVVLEDAQGTRAFHPGEILTDGQVYSYEAKYSDQGFQTATHAEVSQEIADIGKDLAVKIFKLLDGRGYARIDFFLDANSNYWFNEVNPIPGFTNISLLPKITEKNGFPIEKLTSHLISLGLHHFRRDKKLLNVVT